MKRSSKQQADGGFSLSSFVGGWKRHDGTPLETKSDGYATGAVMFVLQQAGMKRDQPQLQRGLDLAGAESGQGRGPLAGLLAEQARRPVFLHRPFHERCGHRFRGARPPGRALKPGQNVTARSHPLAGAALMFAR